jgi:hypothetical protein
VNNNLYGKSVNLPEEVVNHLTQCFNNAKGADNSTEGYRRNKELREKKSITYQVLKRMKNWFDNSNKEKNDLSYILNGGDKMKEWIDRELRGMRTGDYLTKRNKSDTGMQNQFISPHEKDNPNKLSNMDYDVQVTESLKRINELIKKII